MKLQIESTTACNAKCTFCPRYEMTRPMGEMSDELFYKIVKEGKEMEVKHFLPFLNGEPFVFSRIWEWLDYLERQKVWVTLYTNAELIDVDRLLKHKNIYLVNCSLNATTKETSNKVMRGIDFDKAVKNTQDLISKSRFRVRVSMVVNEDTVNEVDDFKNIWGEHAVVNNYANWGGARHSTLEKKKIRKYCERTLQDITILWDGRVNMCCMDYDGKAIFGDINKESLKDISKRIEVIRELHRARNYTMIPCRDCNFMTL